MIRVNYHNVLKQQNNFWNHIHFHPTDAIEDDWGREILDNVAKDGVARTVRMYAMLEDIVSMDEAGRLQYDFSECDTRLDYMLSKGFNLMVSYNFIPKCIAIDPDEGTSNAKNKLRYKGKTICASPPRDYALWEEVCYQFTRHIVERYGLETVSQWYLQCFNEPDIPQYFMKHETDPYVRVAEYLKLYRGFSNGICRVSKQLKAGGPALAHNLVFLTEFLRTVMAEGLKFDFYSGHNYGTSPVALNAGRGKFNVENNIKIIEGQFRVLRDMGIKTEMIFDEWGASTSGFYNREECPALMMREDSSFAAYYGKLLTRLSNHIVPVSKLMICLSGQHEMVTDFSGFRNFFTLNGIKKPIYNAYALAAKLHENILESCNNHNGLEVLATADEGGHMAILLSYSSEFFDKPMPAIRDMLRIDGVEGNREVTLWCIDETHTNPYTRMLRENMQEDALGLADIQTLREEGELKPLAQFNITAAGMAEIPVAFTNNAVVLVEIQ